MLCGSAISILKNCPSEGDQHFISVPWGLPESALNQYQLSQQCLQRSFQKEMKEEPDGRHGDKQGVEPVEEAPMPGHDVTTVLYSREAFEFGLQQVAESAGYG